MVRFRQGTTLATPRDNTFGGTFRAKGRLSGKATIRPGDESAIELSLRKPPLAGVTGMDLRLLCVHYFEHDDHLDFNFLFRLRQLRNNCSNFIEYLVPAL